MGPETVYKQERPPWCTHQDCRFLRRVQDAICGGELPAAQPHALGEPPVNTHRFCIHTDPAVDLESVFDLQVNAADLDYFRWVFDAMDGKQTSWRSKP